ncbi:MAG: hypothetical protein ACTSU5_00040 [Promethearchaeota archaeon]
MEFPRSSPRLASVTYFLLALGVTYGSSEILQHLVPNVMCSVYTPEMGRTETFSLSVHALLDLVLLAFVQSILVLACFRVLPTKLGWLREGADPGKLGEVEWLAIVGAVVSSAGHSIHVLANLLEHWARTNATAEMHGLIYLFDEFIGHATIVVGLCLYLAALLELDPQLRGAESSGAEHRGEGSRVAGSRWGTQNGVEAAFLLLLTVGFGVGAALSIIEGQSAAVVVAAAGVFAVRVVPLLKRGGASWSENPALLFVVGSFVVQIVVFIVWGLVFGFRPTYGFLTQPSELK